MSILLILCVDAEGKWPTFPVVWMPWELKMLQPYLTPQELPDTQLLKEIYDYAMSLMQRNKNDISRDAVRHQSDAVPGIQICARVDDLCHHGVRCVFRQAGGVSGFCQPVYRHTK